MHNDFSVEGLHRFLDYVRDKGLASKSTAQGWVVAVNKVLDHVSEDERRDVRSVDLDAAVRRFANKNPNALSPKSLAEYRRRVAQAVAEFMAWSDDPAGYKPRGTTPARKKEGIPPKKPVATRGGRVPAAVPSVPLLLPGPAIQQASLTLSFPLRSDFLAEIMIPRDLRAEEARRMGAFLLTLASDYSPTS